MSSRRVDRCSNFWQQSERHCLAGDVVGFAARLGGIGRAFQQPSVAPPAVGFFAAADQLLSERDFRLHPILAECARVPIAPVEILGTAIPAGEALVMSIVGIHHDPATYPDPDSFRPERFLERTFSKTEFMPYGGGHRRCLGAGLAEYTLRIGVAEATMRWQFEPACVDHDTRHDLAMGPKYGVPLRVVARRQPRPAIVPAIGKQPVAAMAAVH